jgi:hypothetical protein
MIASVDIQRDVPGMVYGGYDIATALRNIEDIAFYRIGGTRITRLYNNVYAYAYVCTYNNYSIMSSLWDSCCIRSGG